VLAGVARKRVRRAWKRLRGDLARLPGLDAGERHAVRIRAKRLRYAVEFFVDALPDSLASRLARRTRKLQTKLGAANDLIVALGLIDRLGEEARAGTGSPTEAVGLLRGWCAHAIAVSDPASH
jgi:CHAD domain-containing protein